MGPSVGREGYSTPLNITQIEFLLLEVRNVVLVEPYIQSKQ